MDCARHCRAMPMIRFVASVLIVLTIGAATAAHSQDKTITVFAAASVKDALDDVDVTFTTELVSRSSLTMMRAQR